MRTLPLFCLLLLCCSLPVAASALTVTSVSPAVAYADSTRTYDVYGTGFAVGAQVTLTQRADGPPGDFVFAATDEDWVDFTHLRCTITVPGGLIRPPASIGLLEVTVQNPKADSGYIWPGIIVFARPTVAGILPTSRPAPSVFMARLDGTEFRDGAEVYLQGGTGGTSTIYATGETVVSSTVIDCTFDLPSSAYPGPYDVYVRNHPDLDYLFCMNDAFVVQLPSPTFIGSVSPGSAPPGATLGIDVNGYGFTNGAEVRIEGGPAGGPTIIPATGETFVSPTRVRCTLSVPSDAYLGPYTVYLRNPGGAWVNKSNAFTVAAPIPTVTRISPAAADPGQTLSTVYVTGTGFVAGAEVRLEADDLEYNMVIDATDEVRVNATTVRCVLAIPASAHPGPYLVFARNPGTSWSDPGSCSFGIHTPTPSVTGISPARASQGQALGTVHVYGTGFAGGAEVRVRGGTGGTSTIYATGETWVNATAIQCGITVPQDAWPGPYSVEVMNLYGNWVSKPGAFTVTVPVPTISSISPASAHPGDLIYIAYVYGTGFANGADVAISSGTRWIDATGETSISPTQIECRLAIPAEAHPGPYNVSVWNPGGDWVSKPGAFAVVAPSTTVTGISPTTAYPGDLLLIVDVFGTGFTNGAEVAIYNSRGWINATGEAYISPTQIRCTLSIPEGASPGSYAVYVMNPGAGSSLSYANFRVLAPTPTVAAISPAQAYVGETLTNVYVTGTGFATGANVILRRAGSDDIQATGEIVAPPSLITCRIAVPPGAAVGPWDVEVINPTNPTPGTLSSGFTIAGPALPVQAVPPSALLPTDTDGDRIFDDVNGNGRKDFADVVLYFNQMAWIAGNEPVPAFDCNSNGRIDFADVVWLFNHL